MLKKSELNVRPFHSPEFRGRNIQVLFGKAQKGGIILESVLITGGTLWTGDPCLPSAEALLCIGDRIVAVGSCEEIEALSQARGARRISLRGETVLPGMTDSHIHLSTLARGRISLDLEKVRSLDELLTTLREHASQVSPDAWIYGACFNETRWERPVVPTRKELDSLGLSQPVILQRVCTHINVANTVALERGGLLDGAKSEGVYLDEERKPSGVLAERAAFPLYQALKQYLRQEGVMESLVAQTCADLSRVGITSVHPCGAAFYGMEEELGLFQALDRKGLLPVRVFSYHDQLPGLGIASGLGNGKVTYQGWKTFLDGTLGARTAALTCPYADDPGNRGTLNFSDEELKEQLEEVFERGSQPLIHAIGDAALDQALDVLEALLPRGCAELPYPVRINHVQVCRPDQVNRLAALQVVCDVQPTFLPSDMNIAPDRLGERIDWAYAWKRLVDAGLIVTGSSDAPVETPNPFRGIWAAVCRTGEDGNPAEGWTPSQKLSLDEALALYTSEPARAVGHEKDMGRIAPGYLADLVVLDRNLFEIPEQELKDVLVRATFMGGTWTYGEDLG